MSLETPDRGAETILLVLEHPTPGQTINEQEIEFKGFAIAQSGIAEVLIELGGIALRADYGMARGDIQKAYPDHPEIANCGFSCKFDRDTLARLTANAKDSLPLNVIARDKNLQEKSFRSNLVLGPGTRPEPELILQVDEHSVDKRGLLRVQGWVVSKSPVESVNVLIGSEPVGLAEIGLDRPDVAKAWPNFSTAAKSGFLLITDATRFLVGGRSGPQRLTIVAKSASGATQEAGFALDVPSDILRRKPKDTSEIYCDFARTTTAGRLSVGGWALSHLGIDKIRIIFNGAVVGVADYGLDRPDVGNKFPLIIQSRKSGYRFDGQFDAGKLGDGSTVTVEALFFDGDTRRSTVPLVTAATEPEPPPTVQASSSEEIHLHIDEPEVVDGKATKLVEGTFAINGWAVARSGVASIEFELDAKPIGSAYYGIRREDVAKAFPTFTGDTALLSGYAFTLPHRFLVEGRHQITMRLKTKGGAEKIQQFEVEIGTVGEQPGPWLLRDRLPAAELLLQRQLVASMAHKPTIYINLHCPQDRIEAAQETLDSIARQSYGDWKLLVSSGEAAGASLSPALHDRLSSFGARVIHPLDEADAERLIAAARPRDLVLPLDAGDVLGADALFQFALALNRDERVDFIYGDERRPNIGTSREDAFFKPDWSPTLLMSTNYIGRPWCATVACFQAAGRNALGDLSENFDLVLQLTETAAQVAHVQRVLARRDPANLETADSEMQALRQAAKRRKLTCTVEPGLVANTYRCRPKTKVKDKVSIVIPTCGARGLIKVCLDSLRENSTYKNIEIICIENIADEDSEWKPWLRENCDVAVEIKSAFNWSLFNNVAAREASGEYLLFLNDDIEVIQPDWLETMLDLVRQDEVGIVGPQLLYPDRKVQHAGMFLAGSSIARHAFRFAAEDDPGYFGLALTQRDVMAVTGACMLMKTSTFEKLGGFDENHSVVNNDLDFCLRVHEQGLRCIYTPFARLIHHELASRKDIKDIHDVAAFNSRWGTVFAKGDPFYHPTLDKNNDMYQTEAEPPEFIMTGNPLFDPQGIKRILVVKVDHIGDFVTAFPAMRRIKEHFPSAELVVLAAPASKHLARLEPAIDRLITFEFFHAKSQLGHAEVSKEKLDQLAKELADIHFDLAIDLRKQSDTRQLLKLAGARVTAGFDHRNEHSWLDVALTFEGDAALTNKRQHVSGDLLNLVDAVAAAGSKERTVIRRARDWSLRQMPVVNKLASTGLYERRVVCIHPAAGNETKQWPLGYFADLIKILRTADDINFAIIGAPEEMPLAEGILELLPDPERVYNLVGKLRLDELSYFLDSCTLFIGNDSGPKHIAAGLGVPTIGIQSGIVDAREWGPQGETAITARRNVSCSPCYRAKIELCHRNLACLRGLQPAAIADMCRSLIRLERGIRLA